MTTTQCIQILPNGSIQFICTTVKVDAIDTTFIIKLDYPNFITLTEHLTNVRNRKYDPRLAIYNFYTVNDTNYYACYIEDDPIEHIPHLPDNIYRGALLPNGAPNTISNYKNAILIVKREEPPMTPEEEDKLLTCQKLISGYSLTHETTEFEKLEEQLEIQVMHTRRTCRVVHCNQEDMEIIHQYLHNFNERYGLVP